MSDESSAESAGAPVRVLLVEDEDTIRGVLARVLRRDGYDVTEAASAEEALNLFRHEPFPLVVTDIVMSGMTGLELLGEIRHISTDTVMIIMTSHASFEAAREALRAGAYDFLTKPFDDLTVVSSVVARASEKVLLQQRNEELVLQLRQHAGKLETLNTKLESLATRDGMTGLFNHRHFRSLIDNEIARCERHKHECALLFIDVDHFKRYNDENGHLAGDQLLKRIADLLVDSCRKTSVVARYGGEEFVIMLPESGTAGAQVCAEGIRSRAEAELPVTVSIGIAGFPEHGHSVDGIIDRADRALYDAKESGRNRVVVSTETVDESLPTNPEPARSID